MNQDNFPTFNSQNFPKIKNHIITLHSNIHYETKNFFNYDTHNLSCLFDNPQESNRKRFPKESQKQKNKQRKILQNTNPITIYLKPLGSSYHPLTITSNTTIYKLKSKIQKLFAIPCDQQRLIFNGRLVTQNHSQSLSSLGITGHDSIFILRFKKKCVKHKFYLYDEK
ncbi:ubiquilin [Anaeramoeba flamelloides]|uniref:Ubiquilin n=1 Tax=Anaeramoeba flamelloides TaxID=1746091 RepID=A0AAV7YAB7_9EUKA|nr:ubiquilin [Anaeramoeba flamelloides]